MRDFIVTDLDAVLYLMAASVFAGFVRGFCGFGGPAIVSLLLTQLFTPITLVPKVALLDSCSYPALVMSARKHIEWRLVVPLGIGVMLATPFGIWSMTQIDQIWLKRMIAGTAILGVIAIMAGYRLRSIPPAPALFPIGLILGWLLGTTYIAVPLVAFMLMQPLEARPCRASIIALSLITAPLTLTSMFYHELIELSDVLPVMVAGFVYLAMVSVGTYAFRFAGERDYRRAAYWLLLLLAATSLLR